MQKIVYALQDPLTLDIRYVGKTVRGLNRPKQHLQKKFYNGKKTKHYPVYKWIRSLKQKNLIPNIIILKEASTEQELNQLEIYFISQYDNLLNCTTGGDGQSGFKFSEQKKKQISDTVKLFWKNNPDHAKFIINNNLKHGVNKIKIRDQYGNIYNSLAEAASKLGCYSSAITQAMKKNKPCKGFIFTRVI